MPPCAADPSRWSTATSRDPEAQALCRTCPMRQECLRRVCTGPRVRGIWGGFFLPDYSTHQRQYKNQMDSVRHALAVITEHHQEVA